MIWIFAIVCTVNSLSLADNEPTVGIVSHRELQAIDHDPAVSPGFGAYEATDKVVVEGIVLNAPEMILNPTPGVGFMGGQWQIYIQGEGEDHAGTAVWYGQYYNRVGGSGEYTNQELIEEMCRINTDPDTGYIFNPGDRVRVTGWYKFYGGKMNINEKHVAGPQHDFSIELIKPAVGLPAPESITLEDLKHADNSFIYDPNRLYGCEYYQGCLVRIEGVKIDNPQSWGPDQTLTVSDSSGRNFQVKLGIGRGFSRYSAPTGWIDVIGIFDQEAPGSGPYNIGYRVWVPNYDGNGLVLTDRGYQRGNLPGDINGDYSVDLLDLAELSENWLRSVPGLIDCL